MKKLTDVLICALMIIAAVVCGIIAAGGNAWGLIVTYWATLTAKNALDWWRYRKRDDRQRSS